jgi:hypothetical protein
MEVLCRHECGATTSMQFLVLKKKPIHTTYKPASTSTPLYIYSDADTASDVAIIKSCKLVQALGNTRMFDSSYRRWPPKRLAVSCFQMLELLIPRSAA